MLSLLEMSVTGGILIAAIVIIRALSINKLPKNVFLALWAVALCRLLLPFSIPSPASVYSAVEYMGVTVKKPGVIVGGAALLPEAAPRISMAFLLWAAIAIALALLFLFFHLRNRREYAASLPFQNDYVSQWVEAHRLRRPVQVRYSDQFDAPFTYGILWPVIVLPKSLDLSDETRLSFILAHEMAHIRRFDTLTKWILAATLCLHWCNPLVWVMYVLASRDLELSCDEKVVRMYGSSARAPYALTLVVLEERRTKFTPLASSFSKSAMEERIAAIMKSKKTTIAGLVLALLLVVIVTTVFATSSPGNTSSPAIPEVTPTPAPATPPADIIAMENNESWDSTYQVDSQTGHYYTQAQYDLIAALKTDGYEKLSIAEFNRTLNAKMNGDNETCYRAYEMLQMELPQDDSLAPFVYNTIQASLEEYSARMQEVYSGKQVDPEFRGSCRYGVYSDVYGDSIQTGYAEADYAFTYRILDQNKLTVAERDQFLQTILSGMQDWIQNLDMKAETSNDTFKAELDRVGEAAGTANIAYTGSEINYFDVSTER